jgi:hypothetical protein
MSHALRSCVECYIIVQPCEQERYLCRHYLGVAMEDLLKDRAVTEVISRRYNDANDTTLEKLCSMMTGEANAALDHLFETLGKMHDLEAANDRRAPDTPEYAQLGKSLGSHVVLSTTAVQVFSALVDRFRKGMAKHLVLQQISAALIKFIVVLAGPKAGDLKIADPKAFGFDPRELLGLIVACFIKFSFSANFRKFCVESQSSLDTFYAAVDTIKQRSLVAFDVAAQLVDMKQAILATQEAMADEDELFDDAPDELLCAIMQDLLHDPVALPMEGADLTLVNRGSIRHHLLQAGANPFNPSQKLTMEDVEAHSAGADVAPRIAAKVEEIAAWKQQQREAARLAAGQ